MTHGDLSPREGLIPVDGGRVWYRIVGDGPGVPLLTLHGGPGCPHDYLLPLAALGDERPVVFYDQLGCGRSDHPTDPALWRIERFVNELATLRAALGLERVHILGHSWGTMLATDYALTRPTGIASLVLASPAISIPRWVADLAAYRARLPRPIRETLDRHEAAGTIASPEYLRATTLFYQHHVCRMQPWPEIVRRSFDNLAENVYNTMWGPNEFTATGNLRDYDRTDRLGEIAVSTLFTCGRFDEATPATTAYYQSQLPGSELVVFERSSHLAMVEEAGAFVAAVRDFLARADRGS
jgi:proline iminopeptidase